jgi:hypothetical protein
MGGWVVEIVQKGQVSEGSWGGSEGMVAASGWLYWGWRGGWRVVVRVRRTIRTLSEGWVAGSWNGCEVVSAGILGGAI